MHPRDTPSVTITIDEYLTVDIFVSASTWDGEVERHWACVRYRTAKSADDIARVEAPYVGEPPHLHRLVDAASAIVQDVDMRTLGVATSAAHAVINSMSTASHPEPSDT